MLLNYLNKGIVEAGCDEAGRGCLSGPVFAAAVIWPKDLIIPEINDSKKLSEKKREYFKSVIEENALAFAIAKIDQNKIDKINILNASILAMHLAIDQLKIVPESLLIDGNKFKPYKNIPHNCIIKGDGKYTSIAAASILAKTYRDAYMVELDKSHPVYLWKKNKGYATKQHREAIVKYGITNHHRKSFCQNIVHWQKELFKN